MKRATTIAHEQIMAALLPGDVAIDATVGNGHDTLFLAQAVGPSGRVLGLDIQKEALTKTQARLAEADVLSRVTLIQASHAEMRKYCIEKVTVVMFNLGYLPGGDPYTITEEASTLSALAQALALLKPGGLLTCVCYPGHPGGLKEAEAVLTWAENVDPTDYRLENHNEKNRLEGRPFLVSLWRNAF